MGKMFGEFAPNSPRSDAPRPAPAPLPPQTPPPPGPAPTGGQDAGGSFRLDADQLQSLIGEWSQLRDDLAGAKEAARPMRAVTGPGRDPASQSLAGLARQSADQYLGHVDAMLDYVDQFVGKLNDALHGHTANDQSAAADLRRKQG